jgi:hypothetical protein
MSNFPHVSFNAIEAKIEARHVEKVLRLATCVAMEHEHIELRRDVDSTDIDRVAEFLAAVSMEVKLHKKLQDALFTLACNNIC